MKAPNITAVLLAILFAASYSSAATLVVTKTTDTNDGVCDADCSLREAVAVAAADDTVVFSSLFNTPQIITLALGQIAITRNLTINGPGRDLLTVSGNNTSRIFRITGGVSVAMSGMKIANGIASQTGDSVGGGIYQTNGMLALTNMTISNNVARQANQPTFGNGGGVAVDTGTLSLLNVGVNNNTAVLYGGGILAVNATINLAGCSISLNTGGGIFGQQTNITIDDSTLENNPATAVTNYGGPTTTIRNSTIRNNGSGVDAGSMVTIDRSLITNNRLGVGTRAGAMISNSVIKNNTNNQLNGIGGGLLNVGGMPLYILNTSIINNTAFEAGGGIYNALAQVYLTNSTISGNHVTNGTGQSPCPGGGIYNLWNQSNPGGTIILTNSTVANNFAQGRGGGICNDAGGTVITRNSIVAGNIGSPGPDFYGAVSSEGNNLIGNTAGSSGWIVSDLQNLNPLLAPLGNNGGLTWTHALLPNSPAINAGNNNLARDPYDNSMLTFDQRGVGFERVVEGNVDMGSYEANYAPGPITVGGRILASTSGRGVSNARITFTDGLGNIRYTQTNPFGYYRFSNLVPGTTYTVSVSHKSYQFDSPQVVTIDQPRDDLDFVALGR